MGEEVTEMKVDAARAKTLLLNIQSVAEGVSRVSKGRNVRYTSP